MGISFDIECCMDRGVPCLAVLPRSNTFGSVTAFEQGERYQTAPGSDAGDAE